MTNISTLPLLANDEHFPSDVARVSETVGRMRLLIGRRVIGRTAIANIAPDLELSHMDVLDAMRRIGGEVTVGAIAEIMKIDPSRGSRLVADLVARGILRRDASQEDGRRSLVARTELGDRLLTEIRNVKRELLARVVEDWKAEDLAVFSTLFEKFVDDFEVIYQNAESDVEKRIAQENRAQENQAQENR